MAEPLTPEQVPGIGDTDTLWRELQAAKQRDDVRVVRAIEARMRELAEERRFAHLSDDELRIQIRGLSGNREPKDLLAYSPASGEGYEGASDTSALNRGIKANQRDGIEVTLAALLDEWRRRGGDEE